MPLLVSAVVDPAVPEWRSGIIRMGSEAGLRCRSDVNVSDIKCWVMDCANMGRRREEYQGCPNLYYRVGFNDNTTESPIGSVPICALWVKFSAVIGSKYGVRSIIFNKKGRK